ncbi:protein sidekick-2-like [Mizuhopecten yessoensis]|uniref:protein sidekick-2-like n=1 Tax=Mizuhopecten yessoensis TaxID=6573 RepID=UPI000B45B069|nr:protein sidekick-2-like [Mizuhopecten yessoensis]
MDFLCGIFVILGIFTSASGQFIPSSFACSSPNSTTFVFTWVRPNDPTSQVQGYHLTISRSDGLQVDNFPQMDIPGYLVQTYTVNGVGKYAVYTANLHCYTGSGDEPDVTIDCMSMTDAPNGAPTLVNATGISYSEVDVVWNEIAEIYRNGILLGYKIVYFALNNWTPKTIDVSNTTFHYVIASLDYDTKYVVSVLAYTSTGDGPQTTDIDKTWGPATTVAPVETKYYCYEMIPGVIEIGWNGMPCTIYMGVIGFLFVFALIFGLACCCSGSGAAGAGVGGGVGTGGGSRVEPFNEYDTDSDDDDDDGYANKKPHKSAKSTGQITSRDIWLASPAPGDFDDSHDDVSSPVPPPSTFIPRVGPIAKPEPANNNPAPSTNVNEGAKPDNTTGSSDTNIVVEDDDGFI